MRSLVLCLALLTSTLACSAQDGPLRNLWNKIYDIGHGTPTKIRYVTWGDSMAATGSNGVAIANFVFPQVAQAYSTTITGPTGYGGGFPNYTVAGAASLLTGQFAYWPDGNIYALTGSGGTISWSKSINGAFGDTIKVYYLKRLGGGYFKLQISSNGTTWIDESGYTNVSTDNPTDALGIITLTKTPGTYWIRQVWVSGTTYFIPPRVFLSTDSGVEAFQIAEGGITLGQMNSSSLAYLTDWLADVQPTVLFFEMKEGHSTLLPDLVQFKARMDAGTTTMDYVMVKSTPVGLGADDIDQQLQNQDIASFSAANDLFCFDAYDLYGTYATANAKGWYQPADGVHRTGKGTSYLSSALIRQMGLYNNAYGRSPILLSGGFIFGNTTMQGVPAFMAPILDVVGAVARLDFKTASQVAGGSIRVETTTFLNAGNIATVLIFSPEAQGGGPVTDRMWLRSDGKLILGNGGVDDGNGANFQNSGITAGYGLLTYAQTNYNANGAVSQLMLKNATSGNGGVVKLTTTAYVNGANFQTKMSFATRATTTEVDKVEIDHLGNLTNLLGENVILGAGKGTRYGSGGAIDTFGSGTPESVVTAPVGSTYRRTDGGAGTSFYVKESGTGNTGWIGK